MLKVALNIKTLMFLSFFRFMLKAKTDAENFIDVYRSKLIFKINHCSVMDNILSKSVKDVLLRRSIYSEHISRIEIV